MVHSKKYIPQIAFLILLLLPVVISAQKNIHAELHIGLTSEYQVYDRLIFGQFIEHFHRQVYGGIFDPGSKLSDEKGFRTDVIDALREMKVSVVRWPGGCFASSYHWLNGIGNSRVPAYEKAWQVEEPNTFGTDEFILWCRKIGAEPFICTNAGTGTMEEMSDWVEYCNLNIGKFGRMRQTNGQMEPFIKKTISILEMACFSPIVNASGVLFVHPKGLVKRTTYHVMSLYANKLQPNSLPVEIISDTLNYNDISLNAVDAIVTCDNAKKLLTIAIVNKHPEKAADCDLGIKINSQSIIATILSGDCVDAYNDIDSPNRVIPETRQLQVNDGNIIIPAHSLVIIENFRYETVYQYNVD